MILNLDSQTNLSGFYIVYDGSTHFEYPGVRGINHLMEHLLCKQFKHLYLDFDKNSITWNAYTSSDHVVFYMTGLDDRLNQYKEELLASLTNGFTVPEEDFLIERDVVLEEYGDYMDNPEHRHWYNTLRYLYNHYGPIGLKKDLKDLSYEDCVKFYDIAFSAPTKIINVSKFNEFTTDLKLAPKATPNFEAQRGVAELEYGESDKTTILLATQLFDDNFVEAAFLSYMLSKGLDSPLYHELRVKRGLTYGCYTTVSDFADKSTLITTMTTSNEKVSEALDILNMIFKSKDKYLTKERFDTIYSYLESRAMISETLRYAKVAPYIKEPKRSLDLQLKNITYQKVMDTFDALVGFDKMDVSLSSDEQYSSQD